MNPTRFFLLVWTALGLALAAPGALAQPTPKAIVKPAAAKTTAPVEALIYSTMPSTAAHRPEMAMDGDPNTYFRSVYGMDDGDDFVILLSRPITVTALRITTGNSDGDDTMTDGIVETAPDSVHFAKAAAFDTAGVAAATLHGSPVSALRIRLNQGGDIPALLVREITLTSPVKISHVEIGPGRGFVDTSQAPDLADWAQRAEVQMEAFWPDTAALLYSDGFITPNMVNVVYRTGAGVTDVAATGGGVMTVNAGYCRHNPNDTGLTVHETAHVVQAMSAYDPVWLIEGTADYIRWVKFEPQNFQYRIDPTRSTYHDSYRTTAAFLGWCELHYDSRLVTKLNQDIRFGTYSDALWTKYCGKSADALWTEFLAAYEADPKGVLTTPAAAADRPRSLPVVTAGAATPVDISAAFSASGITADGATLTAGGGVDGEGSSYSSALLGASPAWKTVPFTLGPVGQSDIVASHGSVLPLPAGQDSSLWLLGTAVEGAQRGQTFRVTYTDGSTQDLVQNLSDWYQPQEFPGEVRAIKMPYRNMANGSKDARPFSVYAYGFALNPAKTVKSLTLPDNPNVKILAVTLAR